MNRFVVDASVAIKWVVQEEGTDDALAVRRACPLSSPDLLVAECSNVLWKKVRRREIDADEAVLASRLLQRAEVEILPTRHLWDKATRLAIELDQPAYDCIYLALALENGWRLVSADERFMRKLGQMADGRLSDSVLSMRQAISLQRRLAKATPRRKSP